MLSSPKDSLTLNESKKAKANLKSAQPESFTNHLGLQNCLSHQKLKRLSEASYSFLYSVNITMWRQDALWFEITVYGIGSFISVHPQRP